MKKLTFVLFFFVLNFSWAQKVPSEVTFINPGSVSTPRGYSHASVVDLGNCRMLLISGQVALDSTGNLVGKGDVKKQTEQVFRNIQKILEAAGGSMQHIVKLGYYIMDASQIQNVRDVRDKYVHIKNPPASTLVQVSRLYREDLLIEIEATAIIPSGK